MVDARFKDQTLFAIVTQVILERSAKLLRAQTLLVRIRESALLKVKDTFAYAQKVYLDSSAK